ncbi:MAG: penicillin-binding transpeptidase domain-containing protein [Clostridia bacterium]
MQKHFSAYSQQKRISAILIAISLFFCAIIIRFSIVQLVKGNWLQAKAFDQWTRGLPLTAKRGVIYDALGIPLATSKISYSVYSRAKEIEFADSVAQMLCEKLNMQKNEVLQKISNKNVSEILVKRQVEKEVAQSIKAFGYAGIYITEDLKRVYPCGDLMTQVLGFTTVDNQGQAGLEQFYNNVLKGVNGEYLVQSDIKGNKLDNTLEYFLPSVSGMNITLTLDSKIQSIIENAMQTLMNEQKPKTATCVIMDPKTGEILGLSSKPSFNLNSPPRDNISKLMQDVKNQAIVDVYEPGSTFKILTMAMAIENNVAKLSDTFYCPGFRIVSGEKIKCWKSVGHGSQTLTQGLCNSCNCVFTSLAERLGVDTFYQMAERFGLGQKTGIEFSGESAGIVMDKKSVKLVDLARMGFGQAIALTPIQLITAISAVVNGGNLMQPYLVKSIVAPNGTVVIQNKPIIQKRVISQQTSKQLCSMIEEVVSTTAKLSFVPGYKVGGKTGTTQKYANGKISGKYIASFVGTYPADNPDYVVLLSVDEPTTGAYYGSIVASPYAKQIFSGIFDYKNIAPQNLEEDLKKVKADIPMPFVEGFSLAKACAKLSLLNLTVEIQGDGEIVLTQLPPAGKLMFKGENVVLIT